MLADLPDWKLTPWITARLRQQRATGAEQATFMADELQAVPGIGPAEADYAIEMLKLKQLVAQIPGTSPVRYVISPEILEYELVMMHQSEFPEPERDSANNAETRALHYLVAHSGENLKKVDIAAAIGCHLKTFAKGKSRNFHGAWVAACSGNGTVPPPGSKSDEGDLVAWDER